MTMDTEELRNLLDEATPGPWERNKENEVCNQIDGEYHAICTDQFCYAPEDEQEANARLIALAPQLAAEVIKLREALEPFAKVAEHDIGCDEADTDVFRPMKLFNHAPLISVGDLRRARSALNHKDTGK